LALYGSMKTFWTTVAAYWHNYSINQQEQVRIVYENNDVLSHTLIRIIITLIILSFNKKIYCINVRTTYIVLQWLIDTDILL